MTCNFLFETKSIYIAFAKLVFIDIRGLDAVTRELGHCLEVTTLVSIVVVSDDICLVAAPHLGTATDIPNEENSHDAGSLQSEDHLMAFHISELFARLKKTTVANWTAFIRHPDSTCTIYRWSLGCEAGDTRDQNPKEFSIISSSKPGLTFELAEPRTDHDLVDIAWL